MNPDSIRSLVITSIFLLKCILSFACFWFISGKRTFHILGIAFLSAAAFTLGFLFLSLFFGMAGAGSVLTVFIIWMLFTIIWGVFVDRGMVSFFLLQPINEKRMWLCLLVMNVTFVAILGGLYYMLTKFFPLG